MTWLDGTFCVAIAFFKNPMMTTILTKEVVINKIPGAMVAIVKTAMTCKVEETSCGFSAVPMSTFTLGISGWHMFFLLVFIIVSIVISLYRERGYNSRIYCNQNVFVKCMGFVLLALVIVCFGNYGPGYESLQFIYAGF